LDPILNRRGPQLKNTGLRGEAKGTLGYALTHWLERIGRGRCQKLYGARAWGGLQAERTPKKKTAGKGGRPQDEAFQVVKE